MIAHLKEQYMSVTCRGRNKYEVCIKLNSKSIYIGTVKSKKEGLKLEENYREQHDIPRRSKRMTDASGKIKPWYSSWQHMKTRCLNKSFKQYNDYGGRGITVCDRWLESSFNFFEDMGERPEGMTLDRINNEKGYFKDNCRWADNSTQAINKRLSRRNSTGISGVQWRKDTKKWLSTITFKGVTKRLYHGSNFDDACKARSEAELTLIY